MAKKKPDPMAWTDRYKRQRPPSRSKNHAVQSYKQQSLQIGDQVAFKRGPRRSKTYYVHTVKTSGAVVLISYEKYAIRTIADLVFIDIPPEKRDTIEVVFQPFRSKTSTSAEGGRFLGALN